jgi:hypothetical protein
MNARCLADQQLGGSRKTELLDLFGAECRDTDF